MPAQMTRVSLDCLRNAGRGVSERGGVSARQAGDVATPANRYAPPCCHQGRVPFDHRKVEVGERIPHRTDHGLGIPVGLNELRKPLGEQAVELCVRPLPSVESLQRQVHAHPAILPGTTGLQQRRSLPRDGPKRLALAGGVALQLQ